MTGRRYFVELAVGLLLYAVLLVVSLTVLRDGVMSPLWRTALGLLPMLGGVAVAVAIVRQFGRMDELQRKIQFDAISFSFLGTALLTLGYGFLENAGMPHQSMFTIWPLMGALWLAGSIGSTLRYRR